MSAYTIRQLRAAAPAEFRELDDADLVKEYARVKQIPFEQAADYYGVAPRGTASEVARQFGAGLAVDLPRMVGQGLKYTGIAPETGEAMVQSADERAPGWQPDMRGRGIVGQALVAGGRGLGPVAASVPLFFVPGGQVVAPLAVGGLFGTSSAQDTYEKLISQGVSEEEASAAARRVGVLQGAGEAAASFVGARTIAPLARGLTGARTTGQVADRLTDTRVLAPFARAYATNLAVQPTTEAIQDVGTEYIERAYGAAPEDAGQIAAESAKAGFGMALLLGPFNFGGSAIRARRSEELKQALYGEQVDPQVRAQAMDAVLAEARRQNIAPQNVDAWFEQQLQIEDARTEALREAEERANIAALANRDKTLAQMVSEEGLTAQLSDQDLLTPGRTSAQAINQAVGLTRKKVDPKKYVKNFEGAFNEPSGQFGADPETGIERELTVGELYQLQNGVLDLTQDNPGQTAVAEAAATQTLRDPRSLFLRDTLGVVPTAPALQLMDAIEQAGIPLDSDIASPVITFAAQRPMGKKQLTTALRMLDEAVINSRRAAAPVVSEVPGVPKPAGVSPTAAPAVVGLSQGIPSGPTTPQAQQTETQGQAAPAAAAAGITPAPTVDRLADVMGLSEEEQNRLDIAAMTGQQDLASTLEDEATGQRVDEETATENQIEAALTARFAKSRNPARDRQILEAYLAATRGSAQGVSETVIQALATQYGVTAAAIRKIGNTETLVSSGQAAGLTRGQVLDAFDIADRSKTRKPETAERAEREQEAEAERAVNDPNVFGAGLAAQGLSPDAGFVEDSSRFWQEESSKGNPAADAFFKLDAQLKDAQRIVDTLAAQGPSVALDAATAQVQALTAQLTGRVEAAKVDIEEKKAKKGEAKPEKGELSAQEKALREKLVAEADAKRKAERKGLEVGDTVVNPKLGTGVIEKFAGNGDATTATIKFQNGQTRELSVKLAPLEKINAVQKQGAAGVPVQPKTEAGQKVGRQVRRAEKPAAEGQAKTEAVAGATAAAQSKPIDQLTNEDWTGVIGAIQGPARADGPNETISIDDATMLKKMVVKAIKDGVKAGKTREQIVAQIESLTKGGITNSGMIRINALIEGQAKTEAKVLTTQERYAEVTAGIPGAPTFDSLTKAQQDQLADLNNNGNLNLAAVNTLLSDGKFGMDVPARKPYTAKELLAEIKAFIRADIPGRKLLVVDSIQDLLNSPDRDVQIAGAGIALNQAYGVAANGRAYLIANRINKGSGRAKFMHEVGAHLGLENLLSKKSYDKLTQQILDWAKKDDGSIEAELANAAAARVMAAGTPKEDQRSELLAYFIEEAMESGIDPTAAGKESGPLRDWFRTLWAAFKTAARALGVKPESMTSQDVVNLAFGAARLEIAGTWHGTAASFRNFRNKFIGSGEGATAYGWGTYLAERVGIAKGYWAADINRKGGASMDTPVYLVDGKPYSYSDGASDQAQTEYMAAELLSNPDKLRSILTQYPNSESKSIELASKWLSEGKKSTVKPLPEGSLMRVDTAVDNERMLDYDKPVIKQSPYVADKLMELLDPHAEDIADRTNKDIEELTGQDLIGGGENSLGLLSELIMNDALTLPVGQNKQFDNAVRQGKFHEAASHYLQANGLDGIRFLDARSRGSATNAVSFDGKVYNRDELREASNRAYRDGDTEKTGQLLVLRGVLRDGVAETRRGLEQQIAAAEQTLFALARQSAVQNGVSLTEEKARADAKEYVKNSLESKQLEWLNANADGIRTVSLPKTRNIVVFDDKNIFRVGAQAGADRQRMKFGTEESVEAAPELRDREGGRVVDLVVNGKVVRSFDLVPQKLWDAFKGDARDNLLNNEGPTRKREEAQAALGKELETYKERAPLNGVERTVLQRLESGNIDALSGSDVTQLRPSIFALLQHGRFRADTTLRPAAVAGLDAAGRQNLERFAPDWMLGKADRPAQPEFTEMPRTGLAPRMRGMKFGKNAPEGINQATRAQPRGTRLNNINRLPKQVQQPASIIAGTLSDTGGKFLDKVMFTSDLVKRATNLGLKSADNLLRSLSARDFATREEERAIEAVLDLYADVPQAERGTGDGSVNRFIFDSTRTGKWGYGPKADPEMKARFNLLSEKSQKLVEAMFTHGDRMLARKKSVVIDNTTSVFDAQIAAAQTDKEKTELRTAKKLSLKRYESLFAITEGRPYAPIKRNGNYVVVAKSPKYLAAEAAGDTKALEKLQASGDDYHVSFVDGKNAGRTLMQQLQDQGGFGDVQLAERDTVTDELFSNEGALQQLSKLRTNVDNRVKAGEKESGPLLNIINQMYLDALAEGSARKSEMKRRGVDGEVDMIASFGTQGRADANFLASLQYSEQVSRDLNRMREEAKTGDRTRKSEVLNEIVRRYSDSLEVPNTPVLDKLTRMSSVYFLATSPAYYLQNLTQPFMMSVPAMAGDHSYAKVNTELFKAYGELAPMMKSASLMKQLDFTKVPADVKNAINQLVNRGRVDIGIDTELGEFKVDGESRFGAAWNSVDKGLRAAVQKGEAINRLSTAIAAYRLAMSKKGATAEDAINYAERILLETHGDYSRFNAPRAFNTQFGRIALQFRKFQLIQLTWYAKMIKQAYSDPAQRGAALRSLAFGLAHTGVLAGAMGLPGYAAVAWALGAVFGDDDEAFDLTDEIRKLIGDDDLANMVLRGVPTLGGADVSGKIGAGNMLSIMPFSNADLTTRSGFYEGLGTLVAGASGGMVVRGVDGLGLLANGDYLKGMELVLPKGLGDMIKAYRLGTDGATRRNNDVILPADELGSMEVLFQALGIPPAQITAMYEKQQRVRDTEQRFTDRTSRIKNDYSQAIRKGDSAAAAEARADWNKLQEARVRAGLKRQPLSNLLKAPREQSKRERETAGGVQFTRASRGMVEDIVER